MFLPIGTDNQLSRRPTVNYALIAVNAAFFLLPGILQVLTPADADTVSRWEFALILKPQRPQLYQFISYAFLHSGWGHILGNMFFLYIFGNNVNDRLGNTGYLLLYLAGGIFSGIGHVMTSPHNVLGASGAVAAVTGAYMVLFPKTYVQILYIIIFIGTTEVPAFYFILFKLIIWDNFFEPRLYGGGNVAYGAHIAGYIFGIGVPMAMLALKLLPHSPYDLWAVFQRWRRRRQYHSMVDHGSDPFTGKTPSRKSVSARVVDSTGTSPQAEQISKLRNEIFQAAVASNLQTAADTYIRLLEIDGQHVMPQQQQLDIANKIMHIGKQQAAAQAYELFLKNYPQYPFLEQVQLMLGLIYARYLNQKDLARRHLQAALPKLDDPGQQQMCRDEIDRLNSS